MSVPAFATTPPPDVDEEKLQDLDPELQHIFGPPPLYEGEDKEMYCRLYAQIRSAVTPKDVIEEIWVRDLIDLTWECFRLRRLKSRFMETMSVLGLSEVIDSLVSESRFDRIITDWENGLPRAREEVSAVLKKASIDREAIDAHTLLSRLDDFERFDQLTIRAERRRNDVLREIDRYRGSGTRRLRAAVAEIEDGEFEDVTREKPLK